MSLVHGVGRGGSSVEGLGGPLAIAVEAVAVSDAVSKAETLSRPVGGGNSVSGVDGNSSVEGLGAPLAVVATVVEAGVETRDLLVRSGKARMGLADGVLGVSLVAVEVVAVLESGDSAVESISIGLSLTFAKVVVDQTSSSIANSLNASSNTGNTSNTDSSSSRGNSNASNTGSVSDNVGGVGNTDGSLGADLLGDVLAVLDGGGVDDGGDLLMALLLLNGFHVFIFKEVKNIQLIVVKKTRVSLLSPILRSTGNVCSPDGTAQPGCIAAQAPESNSLELKDSKL